MDSSELQSLLQEWYPRLMTVDEGMATERVGSKWTRKDILGHLLDSALNNHQRFVRLQLGNLQGFPGYDAEQWVAAGQYRRTEWGELVQLWQLLNRQLARVIEGISPDCAAHRWVDQEVDLQFLVCDYARHMRHHLERMRILGN